MRIDELKIIAFATVLSLVLSPSWTQAGYAEIKNDVSAEANTGGNSAEPGENIITGESSAHSTGSGQASVKVRTEVNGEVIEDIEREEKGTGAVRVKVETSVNNADDADKNADDADMQISTEGQEAEESNTFFEVILNFFVRVQSFILNLFS